MGRIKGQNIAEQVRVLLREHQGSWVDITEVELGVDASPKQVMHTLNILAKKGQIRKKGTNQNGQTASYMMPKGKDKEIGTAIHEQAEAYIATTPIDTIPLVAEDIRRAQIVDEPEMQREPEGTFRVQGSLVDGQYFKGTVVKMTSPGWSDRPYLVTEL